MRKAKVQDETFLDLFFTDEEMHVDKNNREYFLRISESWLQDDAVDWLEEQGANQIYAYFYLKLCIAFLYRDGLIQREVGRKKMSCSMPYIAAKTHVPVNVASKGIELLTDVGLIQRLDDGRYYIPAVLQLIGCETGAAERMRKMRRQYKERGLSYDAIQKQRAKE